MVMRHLATQTGVVLSAFSPRKIGKVVSHQRDRWFAWYPVAIVAGAAGYFSLPREPYWLVFTFAALVVAVCAWQVTTRNGSLRLILTMFLILGFIAAKLRTEYVSPKPLLATTPTIQISGWVEKLEKKEGRRARLLIHLGNAKGIKPAALPEMVRLSGKSPRVQLLYGDRISVRARLFPLPTPTKPRGFDFGRQLWFQGIGATGFYYGEIKRETAAPQMTFSFTRSLQALRQLISRRIIEALPGRSGGLAVALITGDRGHLGKEDAENLRRAGLAHILAISGLHMSLVAGGMFWLVRALLALSVPLTTGHSIKNGQPLPVCLRGLFIWLFPVPALLHNGHSSCWSSCLLPSCSTVRQFPCAISPLQR